MSDHPEVHVGPAGWSYDDWEGIVYEKGLGAARLDALLPLFGTIEINASFYRPPSPAAACGWRDRVAAYPGFRFTAKLSRRFTHDDPKTWTLADRDDFRDGLEPLREAGRLGALLVQCPWFHEASEAELVRLGRIRKAFPEHELVLEVRHRSWTEARVLEEISSLGYSFCVVDHPQARTSIPAEVRVTGRVGYLRLHGQNAEKWFAKGAAAHEKYDYLYTPPEVARLVRVAEELRERTEELYVIANNHFEGKGPANALEIQAALTGRVPAIPASLRRRYPRLEGLGSP